MTNFKPGDSVRMIEDYGVHRKGKEGIVRSVDQSGHQPLVLVDFGFGYTTAVYARRLELIEPERPTPTILEAQKLLGKKVLVRLASNGSAQKLGRVDRLTQSTTYSGKVEAVYLTVSGFGRDTTHEYRFDDYTFEEVK